ncbi:stage V sporulation protein AA [Halanaerobaculum tunisiense]
MATNKTDLHLKIKRQIQAQPGQMLLLEDLGEVVAADSLQQQVEKIEIKKIDKQAGQSVIITALEVIKAIKREFPAAKVNHLGEADIIVAVTEDVESESRTTQSQLYVGLVGILLFLGSAMAIMNFHADVNMSQVHSKIYQLVMNQESDNLLLLQIPYSLGIACGMLLFFNGVFGYKIDDDPSPLEVELYLYKDKIDRFSLHEQAQQAKQNRE